jgi:hypothetical protein
MQRKLAIAPGKIGVTQRKLAALSSKVKGLRKNKPPRYRVPAGISKGYGH